MPRYTLWIITLTAAFGWVSLDLGVDRAAANMVSYEAQEWFIKTWWPGHVVLHVVNTSEATIDLSAGKLRTVRGFIVSDGGRASIIAPTAAMTDSDRLVVELSDGQRCETRVALTPASKDAPFVRVPFCKSPPASGWLALNWRPAPELGRGRRVWLLERPNTIQPGAPPPPPVAIRAFLGAAAPAPMDSYWEVSVKSSIGAPLLDEDGHVICAVFRYVGGPMGPGLCVPFAVAFKGLAE
jgi:hypothetical protein